MKIELITTPNDTLKETGFGHVKSCASFLAALENKGHSLKLSLCRDAADLAEVVRRNPDLAILAVKYVATENEGDIWLSDYFERHNIKYSGSCRNTLIFDSNKMLAKVRLRAAGINTADFFTALPGQYQQESDLPVAFPLFLKPLDAANGNGIDDFSLVTSFAEFETKVAALHGEFNTPVLAEEYLDGREFTVSIISNEYGGLSASAIEIVPIESTKGLRILGSKAKQDDSEELLYIDAGELKDSVKKLAIDAYIQLGAEDYARIDVKADKNGCCYFMEANLVPGMTFGSSYFPKACEIDNKLQYNEVITLMLQQYLHGSAHIVPPADRAEFYKNSVSTRLL